MYKMVEWNETLDLEEFYQEAERRGHRNNANQKSMIASFSRALTEGLSVNLNEESFNSVLSQSIESIFRASVS